MLDKTEYLEIARAYVALSNAHRLNYILPLFRENATYSSSSVGTFTGRDEIGQMMAAFFARFPDVYWRASDYRCSDDNTVTFQFSMRAVSADSGEVIHRRGVESIQFDADGNIGHLTVDVS